MKQFALALLLVTATNVYCSSGEEQARGTNDTSTTQAHTIQKESATDSSKNIFSQAYDAIADTINDVLEKIGDINWDNFHTVEEEKFYRCKQLSAERFEHYINKFGIKTIVNLRGESDSGWWHDEKTIAHKHGVQHFDLPLSPFNPPSIEEILALLYIYETTPRPILIHCLQGADRTGLAAAMWVLDQQEKSNDEAEKQFSLFYRHAELAFPQMHKFVANWRGRGWLLNNYSPYN